MTKSLTSRGVALVGKISSDVEKERDIEGTFGRYAAYLNVIRVIPRLSGELLEPIGRTIGDAQRRVVRRV